MATKVCLELQQNNDMGASYYNDS